MQLLKQKSTIEIALNRALRKERDSNPRYGQAVQRISSPPHSVTLASFLFRRKPLLCLAGAKIVLFLYSRK